MNSWEKYYETYSKLYVEFLPIMTVNTKSEIFGRNFLMARAITSMTYTAI